MEISPREKAEPIYHCPHCNEMIRRLPENHGLITCNECQRQYMVMIDPQTGTVAFVDQAVPKGSEPLWLPKGSIRAIVALGLVAAALVVALHGRVLPVALMSLLLTVVGFYYGFRSKASELSDRLYDPTASREQPLHLPGGAIRTVLIVCLILTGWLLASNGKLDAMREQVEFFIILAGLVVGHYFAKVVRFAGAGRGAIGHVKALAVLAITAALMYVFVADTRELPPSLVTALCGAVSFYFGSRT